MLIYNKVAKSSKSSIWSFSGVEAGVAFDHSASTPPGMATPHCTWSVRIRGAAYRLLAP